MDKNTHLNLVRMYSTPNVSLKKKGNPNVRKTGVTWTRGFDGGAVGQAIVRTVVKDIQGTSDGLWFELFPQVKVG